MDIQQALKKLLPAEQAAEVAKAVEKMIAEQVAGIKAEFEANLDEAYRQVEAERKADIEIAEKGYNQAYTVIAGLMTRIDEQRDEFETALEEGFAEAYGELQIEKAKNETLELEIHAEAQKKLDEMREHFISNIDDFLASQEKELYEAAKKDVLSDPRLAEQRIAIEKMAALLADHLGDDTVSNVTSGKIDEAHKQVEALRGQVRILEAKNLRLSSQNSKFADQVNEANKLISESTKIERKERTSKSGTASGRGQRVVERVLREEAQPTVASVSEDDDESLTEADQYLVLSGLVERT